VPLVVFGVEPKVVPLRGYFFLWGAGEVASGVFYLEVSLALVGVASPAYSNNRIHLSELQQFFVFIFQSA
jgi:hypothetical protein